MQKMLCPFCDHEIKGKGKCDFCGSRVSKPVIVETTAELNATASANPNECDCNLHAPKEHPHDDTYRDSEDASYQEDYERAYGADSAQGTGAQSTGGGGEEGRLSSSAAAGRQIGAGAPNGAPRRAVLASEAVERATASGDIKPGKTTGQKVGRVILIILAVNVVLQILFAILGLL